MNVMGYLGWCLRPGLFRGYVSIDEVRLFTYTHLMYNYLAGVLPLCICLELIWIESMA
jgi:hypothetical protein